MTNITETIVDKINNNKYTPKFDFKNDLFDTLTNKYRDERCHATYTLKHGIIYINFYDDNEQIGLLSLKPKNEN